jgi:hypothetical protein
MEGKTYRQIIGEQFKATWGDLDAAERVALRTLWFRPRKRAQIEAYLFNHAQADGLIDPDAKLDDVPPMTVGAPDWQAFFGALGGFIKDIAPLIIQLLPLFIK